MGLAEGPPDMVVLPRIILLLMLGSLVGFCCYAWLAWNNFSTIKKLKKGLEVEIYESTWISKIIKTVAYVWIVAVTLLMFIYSVSLLVAITNAPILLIAVGILTGGCCFAWSTLDDYSTIKHLKNQLAIDAITVEL